LLPVDTLHHETVFFDVIDALTNDHRKRDSVVAAVAFDGDLQRNPENRTIFDRI
jgi:hypothetical protein